MPLVIDSGSTLDQLDAFTAAMEAGRSVVVTHSRWGDPSRTALAREVQRAKELADDRFPPHGRLIVFTSGSTGRPRAVVRSIESWQASAEPFAQLTGLGDDDVVWVPGPLSATLSLYAGWNARSRGNRVVLGYRPHPTLMARVTIAHMVPSMLRAVADAHAAGMLPNLQRIVVAGETVPQVARRGWRGRGVDLCEYYGAAELSISGWRHDDGLRAFPGAEVDIRDGELWVSSPYLSLGYLTPDEDATLRMDGGWATVGDRAVWVDQATGTFEVLGRGDTEVSTDGREVDIAAVESCLREIPGVEQVLVLGVPDPRHGEVGVAVITGSPAPQALHAAVASLPEADRPVRWAFPAHLPLTVGGMVDRAMVQVALLDRELSTGPLPVP